MGCPFVNGIGQNAEVDNPDSGNDEGDLSRPRNGDGRVIGLGAVQVEVFDDVKVVVEGDEGVENANQSQPPVARIHGRFEQEELGEKASRRGNATQRQQRKKHDQGQIGRTAAQAVKVAHLIATRDIADDDDHPKGGRVGQHIHEQVEHHRPRARTIVVKGDEADEDVTRLGDAGIGQHAFDVSLVNGGQIAQGHGGNGHRDQDRPPIFLVGQAHGSCTEQAQEDGKPSRFRGCGKNRRDGGWRTFVDIGGPEVEGHGRYLEAKTDDNHHGRQQNEGVVASRADHIGDGVDVRRPSGATRQSGVAIEQAEAIEHDPRGKRAINEVFDTRFGRTAGIGGETSQDVEGDAGRFEG